MKKYLLDTNICIFYMKGAFNLKAKIEKVKSDNCFISEITLAELKFGVENSTNKEKHQKTLNDFMTWVKVIPIFHSLDLYAKEKARLRKAGMPVDEFDILIGVTAVKHNLIMLTNNVREFIRLQGIQIEDWTKDEV